MIFSFDGCEFLLRKYATRCQVFSDQVKPKAERNWKQGPYVPPTSQKVRNEMKRLRAEGMTVGNIARHFKVSYETARKHSKIGGAA